MTSICQNSHCGVSIDIIDFNEGVDRVVISSSGLKDSIVPGRSVIKCPFLFLKTHRISKERTIVVLSGQNVESDLFSLIIIDRDAVKLSLYLKSKVTN